MCGHNIQGTIYPECFLGYGPKRNLRLGEGSFCNYRCFFDLGDDIIIGENCSIAFGGTFCKSGHWQEFPEKSGRCYNSENFDRRWLLDWS